MTLFYRVCRFICWVTLKFCFGITIIGRNNIIKKGKCVVVCNHYAASDVLHLGVNIKRQMFIVSKKELFEKNKLINWLLRKLGAIPIDRNTVDLAGIKACLQTLKDDKMLVIFPEGTRNKLGGEMQDVKGGAAMFAIKGKAPIIPMAFHEAVKPYKRAYIKIGEPFELSEFYGKKLDPETLDTASTIIADKIVSLKKDLYDYVLAKKGEKWVAKHEAKQEKIRIKKIAKIEKKELKKQKKLA